MTVGRYIYLDGLRGIAALLVLTRHTLDYWGFGFYHSYLAVDLFFLISGFVLAASYDSRLLNSSLAFRDFVVLRVIRLYPLFLFSLVISAFFLISLTFLGKVALDLRDFLSVFVFSMFFLPSRFLGDVALFSLNAAYWSLFYEFVVNLIYGACGKFFRSRVIFSLVLFFGILVAAISYFRGDLDVGASWKLGSIVGGFCRAMFGFWLGVYLCRGFFVRRSFFALQVPWLFVLLVSLLMICPDLGVFNFLIDLLAVFCVFPLSVLILGQSHRSTGSKITSALGSASYSVYVLHLPFGDFIKYFLGDLVVKYSPWSGVVFVIVIFCCSLCIDKYYDIPVRKYLTRCFS